MAGGSTTIHVRADTSEFMKELHLAQIQVERIQAHLDKLYETARMTRESLEAIQKAYEREEQE